MKDIVNCAAYTEGKRIADVNLEDQAGFEFAKVLLVIRCLLSVKCVIQFSYTAGKLMSIQ